MNPGPVNVKVVQRLVLHLWQPNLKFALFYFSDTFIQSKLQLRLRVLLKVFTIDSGSWTYNLLATEPTLPTFPVQLCGFFFFSVLDEVILSLYRLCQSGVLKDFSYTPLLFEIV